MANQELVGRTARSTRVLGEARAEPWGAEPADGRLVSSAIDWRFAAEHLPGVRSIWRR